MPQINDNDTVREILRQKKASVRNAPLEADSPSRDDILEETWIQVKAKADANLPGYKIIKKLLSDSRFDR
jgi:hypothetical protein